MRFLNRKAFLTTMTDLTDHKVRRPARQGENVIEVDVRRKISPSSILISAHPGKDWARLNL
jgi:hypothetical protein